MTLLRRRAILLGILVLALAARIANLRGVFPGGDVVLFFTDAYYHLRRAWLTALHFPHVPSFDTFVNYPEGAIIYWGPALDWLVAGAAWIRAGGAPDLQAVSQVGAWAPVALGLLNVVLVYLAGREAFSVAAGLLAAGFFALSPLQIGDSAIGNLDHHVAELLFFTAALWLLLRALRSARPWIPASLAGLAFALGLLFWPGATVAPSLLCAAVMASVASAWIRGGGMARGGDLLRALSIALGSAALLFAPFAFLGARGGLGAWSYFSASWFHEMVLLLLMAAALLFGVLEGERRREGGIALRRVALWLAIPLGALGLLMLLAPDFRTTLAEGISSYLFRRDPMLHAAMEMNPMFHWTARRVLRDGTVLLPLALLLITWALVRFWRGRGADTGLGLVACLALVTLPLIVMQFYRYGPYHILPLSLLAGWALTASPVRSVRWKRAAAAMVLFLFVPTVIHVLRPTRLLNGVRDFAPVNEALQWMRYNTPPTRGLRDPSAKPEYAVLALWDYGHWINVIAERANIANPFGIAPQHIRGVKRGLAVLMEEDPERAAQMCEKWGARYVIATLIMPYFENLASLLGRPPESYGFYPDRIRPTPRFFRTFDTRLLFTDGGPAGDGSGKTMPALGQFRLVYESPDRFDWDTSDWGAPPPGFTERSVAAVKIYEQVRGAVLSGRVRPFFPVRAEVGVRTNIGRTFVWQNAGLAGPDGRFRLRVPYGTGQNWLVGLTRSPNPYRVTCGGRQIGVSVSPVSVLEGREVDVPCDAGSAGKGESSRSREHDARR